ncbi:hypothetical protein [Hyalangium versicolor]|uniref:hypothetical protein n=1 Tax=Hyalangium versicolor TaxID=2861190 RepID=UPI001CCCCE91|nr:hypothetical protein [Hyalangium versicolor]
MRAESSNEATRSESTTKSESKSEKDNQRAEKANDEAKKAAQEAKKAAEEAKRAADEANRATTEAARRSATQRAEQAARNAAAASAKAQAAAQTAEQAAKAAHQSAGSNPVDARAAQAADKAAGAARSAAQAASLASTDSVKTLNTLRTPGKADSFAASSSASASSPASSAATAGVRMPPLPPAAQATVDQARQAQATAQAAAAASTRAELNVQQAQTALLQAQRAATLARNDLEKGPQGPDRGGYQARMLKDAADSAMRNLAVARQTLATAQAEAATAATKAREAAGTASMAALKVDQLALQQPAAFAALNSLSTDTRRAATMATNGAARADAASKPQPTATVSYDLRFERQDNGGQHDIVFDGALIGGGGNVYPPGTDASQIPGVLPNNGTAPTGERIYYVNGIQNTASFQSQSIQNIANTTGAEVVGIHNSTEGGALDLQQCLLDKLPSFPLTNAATRAMALQIVKDLQAGRPVHLMAHSQGGLVTSGALKLAKEYLETVKPGTKAQADALLKSIKVETFGSAAASWPYGPQYTHYINESDTVPMIAGLGRQMDPQRQENAGGDRATIHIIRDDPRTPNPLLWSPETNLGNGVSAHDFNDGYLSHRQPWDAGHANSADLSGPSPVAVRDPESNELQGYNYYVLDTQAPAMQRARELRNDVEQVWQGVGTGVSIISDSINDAGTALADTVEQTGQALSDTASTVGSWFN